ncbi:MAG: hypothetical protein U0842_26870 [Candidatus Binatia bacterium]
MRTILLLGVVGAAVLALRAPAASFACASTVRACAQSGAPLCGATLGPWRVARSRTSGLDPAHSHSACILRSAQPADAAAHGDAPVVSVLPQPIEVSGDTLLSRTSAARRDAQRATVRIDVVGSLPDHWDVAVAGAFLDVGDAHGCTGLDVVPPRNAGYALIAGNWEKRPHGFYFERLLDACVYDGMNPACPGEPAFLAHEFAPDESFALDVALHRRDDGWWLDATVASRTPGSTAETREIGRMRLRVAEPCWLAAGDTGRAAVIVIPGSDPRTYLPTTRVDVSDFSWREQAGERA